MTPTIPHVLWLVFGLLLFGVSISMSIAAWLSNTKDERGATKQLRTSLYDSARSNLDYRDERDRCEEEKRNLQDWRDTLFTSLQLEAIQLAYDLGELEKKYEGQEPQPDKPHTFEGIIENALGARWEWTQKMRTEYEDKYAPRVLAFSRTLGYAGKHNVRLQNFVERIVDLDSVNTLRAQLWKEALYPLDIDFQGE